MVVGGVDGISLDEEVFGSVVEGNAGSAGDEGLARATFWSWGVANMIVPTTYWFSSSCEKYDAIVWLRATLNFIFDLLWAGVIIVITKLTSLLVRS